MMAEPFPGVIFEPDKLEQADRVEVWGSDFKEPGPDYCLYRLMAGEVQLVEIRQDGY